MWINGLGVVVTVKQIKHNTIKLVVCEDRGEIKALEALLWKNKKLSIVNAETTEVVRGSIPRLIQLAVEANPGIQLTGIYSFEEFQHNLIWL